ncbi:hypothetical protein N7492_001022 [Penicillium capsulatum]|uniref:Uncharacterized protein n=1 Tax=Penicillium capsulatum TaxID=69766 RepID=A0A9W9IWY1_9EURO|nr:hypothetical protein N7492_001022 [Penicillium capsulatum]KAJ6129918.1 hypothetical protein N7512_002698 [Penicillium capsulatum]
MAPILDFVICAIYFSSQKRLAHTTTGCGKQGFPSAQPYLSHTPPIGPGFSPISLNLFSLHLTCLPV